MVLLYCGCLLCGAPLSRVGRRCCIVSLCAASYVMPLLVLESALVRITSALTSFIDGHVHRYQWSESNCVRSSRKCTSTASPSVYRYKLSQHTPSTTRNKPYASTSCSIFRCSCALLLLSAPYCGSIPCSLLVGFPTDVTQNWAVDDVKIAANQIPGIVPYICGIRDEVVKQHPDAKVTW